MPGEVYMGRITREFSPVPNHAFDCPFLSSIVNVIGQKEEEVALLYLSTPSDVVSAHTASHSHVQKGHEQNSRSSRLS